MVENLDGSADMAIPLISRDNGAGAHKEVHEPQRGSKEKPTPQEKLPHLRCRQMSLTVFNIPLHHNFLHHRRLEQINPRTATLGKHIATISRFRPHEHAKSST